MVKPPSEQQAQVITSPDGKAQILNHRKLIGRFGEVSIEGAVKNISSEPSLSVEVKAEYYDFDGEYIDCELDLLQNLEPNATSAFEAMFLGRRRGEVNSYKLAIRTIQPNI